MVKSALLWIFGFLGLWALLLGDTEPAAAQSSTQHTLSGWTHDGSPGVLLAGREINYSSPTVADFDGDPTNGLEVAATGNDAVLYLVKSDGSLLWSAILPSAKCSATSKTNKAYGGPAAGDIDGDGIIEVVVPFGGIGGERKCAGGVAAYSGPDGHREFLFDTKKFNKKNNRWFPLTSVMGSPALADTNGDGKMEIGFGSHDRNVYLLNSRGKAIWVYHAADTVWSSPAFRNIDKDPELEMLIGTDISAAQLSPPTENGGYVLALKTTENTRMREAGSASRILRYRALRDRRAKKKKDRTKTVFHSFRTGSVIEWSTFFDQVIFSSPVVADVLPDSPGDEVVITSGCFFPQESNDKRGKWVKILRSSNGEVLQTYDTVGCSESGVAVGDVDEDGLLEIVAAVNGTKQVGGDGSSRLYVWDPENTTPKWEIIPRDNGNNDGWGAHFHSPIVVDIDQNGSLEVILANARGVGIYSGKDGTPLHCYENNCADGNVRLSSGTYMRSTPAVIDIDGNGKLDLVIGAGEGSNAVLYGWSNFDEIISSSPGTLTPGAAPYPMHRGNAANQGVPTP